MGSDIPTFAAAIMPRSTIKNCAKTVLKEDTNIQKEALTALTRGSTVFISYLTAYANEIALSKKRKTIMPADVLEALKVIEFERFVPEMQALSESIDNEAKEKRERKKLEATAMPEPHVVGVDDADGNDVEKPSAKKARTVNGHAANHVNSTEDGDPSTIQNLVDEDQEDDAVEDDDGEDEDNEEDEDEDGDEENQENTEDGNLEITTNGVEEVEEFENRQIDTYDEVLDNGEDSDLEVGDDQDTA